MGKGVFHVFYLAPLLRYTNYNASTFIGGVLLGAQWRNANKVYFDWFIFGPQYDFSSGELSGTKTLNADEQQNLREQLNDIDLPVGKIKSTVTGNGANVKLDGPLGWYSCKYWHWIQILKLINIDLHYLLGVAFFV
jgi:hypothetical protein